MYGVSPKPCLLCTMQRPMTKVCQQGCPTESSEQGQQIRSSVLLHSVDLRCKERSWLRGRSFVQCFFCTGSVNERLLLLHVSCAFLSTELHFPLMLSASHREQSLHVYDQCLRRGNLKLANRVQSLGTIAPSCTLPQKNTSLQLSHTLHTAILTCSTFSC